MDFLNKTFAQFADLFRAMTPATRVTTATLFAVVVMSLVFLLRFGIVSSDAYLFGGRVLDQEEIVRLEAAFSQAGLSAYEVVANRMRVPSGQRHAYIAAAADGNALPKDFYMILEDSIKNSNPFESGQVRDAKTKTSREIALGKLCGEMQGIEKARVTIHESRPTGLKRDAKTTAVVAAQADRGEMLSEQQVHALRQTIAAGIGTAPENVTVTDLRGPAYAGSTALGSQSGLDYAKAKADIERLYQEKIQRALLYIPGAIVEVNAELNTRLSQKTQTQTYSQPQTVRSVNSNIKSTSRSEASGGRPGAVPNGVIANRPEEVAATSSGGSESTSNESHEENEARLGQEISEYAEAGLTPKEVFAAIQIPKSYFLTIWQQQNPPAADGQAQLPKPTDLARIESEETTRIRESVLSLVPPLTMGTDPRPRITVTSYEPMPVAEFVEPGIGAKTGSFLLANWRTIGLCFLALMSLLLVRSMVRGGQRAMQAPPAPTPTPAPTLAAIRSQEPDGTAAAASPVKSVASSAILKRKFSASGPNLRDELAELVREDPDTAAAIISNWIGDAV